MKRQFGCSFPLAVLAMLAGLQLLGPAIAQTNLTEIASTNATNAANTSSTTNASATSPAEGLPGAPPTGDVDLSNIPEACSTGGQDLQTFCSDTINAAQVYFNVPADAATSAAPSVNITEEQVQAYIEQAAAPSPECCKAACDFNANYCNCEEGVLAFAVQLTGNNPNIFRSIAEGFERSCFYNLMFGPTCPSPAERATQPKDVCAPVTPVPAGTRPAPARLPAP